MLLQSGTALPAPGYVVADPDSGDSYTYSIAATGGTPYNDFSINSASGVLSFAVNYDVPTYSTTANLTVVVTDAGGLTATTTVYITITSKYKYCTESRTAT